MLFTTKKAELARKKFTTVPANPNKATQLTLLKKNFLFML